MTHFAQRFFLLVLAQVVLVLGILGYKELTRTTGTRVLLRTEPIDPTDPFRGEYVVLSYPFSRLPVLPDGGGGAWKKGDTVYVTLGKQGRFHDRETVSRTAPTDGTLFLQGRISSVGGESCRVEYGIESWFVARGKGSVLEQEGHRPDRQLLAEVAVDGRGHAVLRQVSVEPKRPSATR